MTIQNRVMRSMTYFLRSETATAIIERLSIPVIPETLP